MARSVPELKLFLNQTQEQQVYYPGQEVSGSLQVVVRESNWYQYVRVGLKGKGEVSWEEGHTEGQYTYTTTHSDNETYVDQVMIVWRNKEASQPTKLDPGTFNFPFQFTIPPDCPPTFETNVGKISYHVYGSISNQVKQYKIDTPLILNHVIDLNQQPNYLQPVEQSAIKDITACCCFKSGAAHITFKMPKTGFCVGQERIPITFECRNGSSHEISVRAELALVAQYKARGHTKRSYETIVNFPCQIRSSESDTKSVEFVIPPTIPMPFTGRIITASYGVNVWVNPSLDFSFISKHAGPPISVAITIGNVPFRCPQTSVPDPAQPVPAGGPSQPQDLPPSYVPGYPPLGPAALPEGPVQPLAMPEHSVIQAAAAPSS